MSIQRQLVEYELDSDSDDELEEPSTVHPKKLPLPSSIYEKPNLDETEVHIDRPEEHEGRLRSFPHERGNWATFVCVPVIDNPELDAISENLLVPCSSITDFRLTENLHITLSRTVVLQYHWINEFVSSLKEIFSRFTSFPLGFDQLSVYCNDDCTRTFVGYRVDIDASEILRQIVFQIDDLLSQFKLPPFYKDCSFHVSLLWCVGNKKSELSKILPKLQNIASRVEKSLDSACDFQVSNLQCKSGNKIYNFYL